MNCHSERQVLARGIWWFLRNSKVDPSLPPQRAKERALGTPFARDDNS